jgi:hypothetical protein
MSKSLEIKIIDLTKSALNRSAGDVLRTPPKPPVLKG